VQEKLQIAIGTKGEAKPVQTGETAKRRSAYERGNIEDFKLQDAFTRGRDSLSSLIVLFQTQFNKVCIMTTHFGLCCETKRVWSMTPFKVTVRV